MNEESMKKYLKDGEELCDLQRDGLFLIQPENTFHFGTDAVLLTDFAHIKKKASVIDLGTGNGIIPILLAAKTEGEHFTGVEIQDVPYDAAVRSVEMNGLGEKITVLKENILNLPVIFPKGTFDGVVSNPPYKKADSGIISDRETDRIARHEILCTLEDIIRVASLILKQYGTFDMVNRPERLADTLEFMRKYRIEPKELRFVKKNGNSAPVMFLIHGVYLGGKNLKVLPDILTENLL